MRNPWYCFTLSKHLTLVCGFSFLLLLGSMSPAQQKSLQSVDLQGTSQQSILNFLKERAAIATSLAKPVPSVDLAEKQIFGKKMAELFLDQTPAFRNALKAKRGTGGLDGGGGDSRAIEFFKIARTLLGRLSVAKGLLNLNLYQALLDSTDVVFVNKELFLNGVRKEAINYPLRRHIDINIAAWDMLRNENSKSALILHEFLGLLRIDDIGYEHSTQILSAANILINRDYSEITAEPGSRLESYDLVALQLTRAWNQQPRDLRKVSELSGNIIRFFFGFGSFKMNDDERSVETAYYIATNLRKLLPYSIEGKGFFRLSDLAVWSAAANYDGYVIPLGALELVIEEEGLLGIRNMQANRSFQDKLSNKKARIIGCQVTVPSDLASSYSGVDNLLRPIFLVAGNCLGNSFYVDRNINALNYQSFQN